MFYLHDSLTDSQFEKIQALFEHNLDIMLESKSIDYKSTVDLFNNVLDFKSITKEELRLVIDFVHTDMLIYVENYVDEEVADDYYYQEIKDSFTLYRTLVNLK